MAKHAIWPSMTVAVGVLALGWKLSFLPPWHQALRAKSVADFVRYALHCAAWPCPRLPWLAAIFWLPTLLSVVTLIRRRSADRAEWFGLAVAIWGATQIGALAFSRGVDGGYPAARYGDVLAVGLVANTFLLGCRLSTKPSATAEAAAETQAGGRSRVWRMVAFAAWAIIVCGSVASGTMDVLRHDLPEFKQHIDACELSVRRYVRSGDDNWLARGPLPLPFKGWLKETLDRPGGRAILPIEVRAPRAILDRSAEPLAGAVGASVPPLEFRRFAGTFGKFGSAGSAEWRSEPLQPGTYPYWAIDIAGDLGAPGISIRLESMASGAILVELQSSVPVGARWKTIYVRVPQEPFRVVVKDTSNDHWIGWSEPVEISRVTYFTLTLLKSVRRLRVVSGLAVVLAIVGAMLAWKTKGTALHRETSG